MSLRTFLFNFLGPKNVDNLRYLKFYFNQKTGKTYEKEMKIIPKVLSNRNKVLIDLGANYGMYSLYLSKLYPKSRIFAFEPVTRTFNILEKVKDYFDLKNVELIKKGLGSKKKRTEILLPNKYTITAHIFEKGMNKNPEDEIEEIEIITLDNFVKEKKLSRIDFIKCDVEGFELEIFRGGKNTIRRFKPIILVEIEERHTKKYNINPQEVINFLRKLGYSSFALKGNQMKKSYKINKNLSLYLFIPRI